MKKWIIIFLIFFIPMGAFFALSKNEENLALDIQPAYAADKPNVYKFSSSMCRDCQELEKLMKIIEPTYQDKINFISYKVDRPNSKVKKLIKKYQISLVPTMILTDEDDNEKLKIEGLISQDLLEKHLQALIENE